MSLVAEQGVLMIFFGKIKSDYMIYNTNIFVVAWFLIRFAFWEYDNVDTAPYIGRVVKSGFFFRKILFYFLRAQHVLSYHLI